jgi:hypothetical protein
MFSRIAVWVMVIRRATSWGVRVKGGATIAPRSWRSSTRGALTSVSMSR